MVIISVSVMVRGTMGDGVIGVVNVAHANRATGFGGGMVSVMVDSSR